MFGLFTGVANAIKNVIFGSGKKSSGGGGGGGGGGGWGTSSPAPAPAPRSSAPAASPITQVFRAVSTAARVIQQARSDPGAALRAAAEAARRAEEEARRVREEMRRQKQAQIDRANNQMKSVFVGAAKTAVSWLQRWKQNTTLDKTPSAEGKKKPAGHEGFATQAEADSFWRWYVKQTPEQQKFIDNYNKTLNEYAANARKNIDAQKAAPKGGFLETVFDKVTFGGTRRALDARTAAQRELQTSVSKNVAKYENQYKNFIKVEAAKRAQIEASRSKGWAAYNAAVNDYNNWYDHEFDNMMYLKAATEGMAKGYGEKAEERLTNLPGKVATFLNDNVANTAPVKAFSKLFQYTLGSGDENMPSLVTAPSRAINFLGNVLDPNGKKNYYEGVVKNGVEKGKNAWQATFNQRNFNWAQPGEKAKFSEEAFQKYYKSLGKNNAWFDDIKNGRISDAKAQEFYRKTYKMEGDHESFFNPAAEFLADPLFFTKPLRALGKAGELKKMTPAPITRFLEAAKGSKVGQGATHFLDTLKNNKALKWLGAESKTRSQVAAEAAFAAKKADYEAAARFMPQFARNQRQFARERDTPDDLAIFDEFKALAEAGDDEALAILQRSIDGKLAFRDRMKYWTPTNKGKNPRVTYLQDLSRRWTDYTEKLVGPDRVLSENYGRGKKFYAARIDYSGDHTLDNYDFLAKKGASKRPQTAQEFYANQVNRLFKSEFQPVAGRDAQFFSKNADRIKAEYDEFVRPTREAAAAASAKTKTAFGRAQRFMGNYGPTAIWKKAVLKYRPAWYVNNFLYNTQATALSAGGRGVVEQFRLMRPKNYRQAMKDLPADVKSDVASEIGNDRVSRFGSYIENVSRLGSYNTLRAQGLSHADALKRTNRYLLNYGVKNIERPLKTVLPFYSFHKGIAKASVQMPFYNPGGAKAYNLTDRYQQGSYDRDFDKVRPELKRLGYSDEEIEAIYNEQAKFYRGKLKIGDMYLNTPFNAFADSTMARPGLNPWIAAAQETALSEDNFGRKLRKDSHLGDRLFSKFPQLVMADEAISKFITHPKNVERWIGKNGDGPGMTKEAQGFDPSKPNYRKSLDESANLGKNALSFLGVPGTTKFDTDLLLQRKTMQKLKEEYFAVDWDKLPYEVAEPKRQAMFKKYGVTASEFYDGELARYDSDFTKGVKALKTEAREKTKQLFDEYSKQPVGTRGVWATKKLQQLVDSGYFDKNPYLKSFDWLNPDTIAKAHKKMAYDEAVESGDWTKYRAIYGTKKKAPSAKQIAYQEAKRTGSWGAYHAKYGAKFSSRTTVRRSSPHQFEGKFFKSAESMAAYKEGQFWKKYAASSKSERLQLLADNPEYNRRANWSDADWAQWRDEKRATDRKKLKTVGGFLAVYEDNLAQNSGKASEFVIRKQNSKNKTLALPKFV